GLEQGATSGADAERLDQLQISAGHLVQPEKPTAPAHAGTSEVWQPTGLKLAEIAYQGSGRAQRRIVPSIDAEPVERCETEAAGQLLPGELGVEFPLFSRGQQRVAELSGPGEL